MLILLNKLTLQKELQHFVTNNVLKVTANKLSVGISCQQYDWITFKRENNWENVKPSGSTEPAWGK